MILNLGRVKEMPEKREACGDKGGSSGSDCNMIRPSLQEVGLNME